MTSICGVLKLEVYESVGFMLIRLGEYRSILIHWCIFSSGEEGEEASEEKDKDDVSEDSFTMSRAKRTESKPSRTIDLGAAANFGRTDSTTTSTATSTSTVSRTTTAPVSSSSDFFDLFSSSSPPQASNPVALPAQNVDFFASSSSTAQSQSSPDPFGGFQSASPAAPFMQNAQSASFPASKEFSLCAYQPFTVKLLFICGSCSSGLEIVNIRPS